MLHSFRYNMKNVVFVQKLARNQPFFRNGNNFATVRAIDTDTQRSPKHKKMAKTDAESETIVITPRDENYAKWYSNVIAASDMIDHSPVRGCMVIKPWGMGVWDQIRADLDSRIRDSGAQNAYFPLFIPMSFLSKEAEHVQGFAKECAVVTHHRLRQSEEEGVVGLVPDPAAKLEEPLVVRPTSETIIWHMFSKWIHSHRDLPLKINQWANVVRWELRTRPFLRTSEFLWQEGHTAHASEAEAVQTAREAIDMYASLCEDLLAIPCIKGEKSPSERFAGAASTFTIEAMMQNGWALQAGTSHFLGQNFAKAFDVTFDRAEGGKGMVWATSWGVSTRLIGATVMTHSDDKGLVLPPFVAPVQVVIVPIVKTGADNSVTNERVALIEKALKSAKVRVKVDDRLHMRPGAKYFEWERKGLPIRIEIGPRDVENNVAVTALRHNGAKTSIPCSEQSIDDFVRAVKVALQDSHDTLLQQARARLMDNTHRVSSYDEMKAALSMDATSEAEEEDSQLPSEEQRTTVTVGATNQSTVKEGSSKPKAGFFLVPWKCSAENEEWIKKDCRATIRCYPLDNNASPPATGVKCFYSGDQATHYAVFARAY